MIKICAMNSISYSIKRLHTMDRQLRLFLVGMLFLGISAGVFEPTFNNYVSDTFNISAKGRGCLEFPRELPGFLTTFLIGAVFFLPETLIAGAAALCVGIGMIGLAVWGTSWTAMMFFMILWSTGAHLIMPVRSSVGMHLAEKAREGRRLGQVHGVGIAGSVVGCVVVVAALRHLQAGYSTTFMAGGVAGVAAAGAFLMMRLPGAHIKRPKLVWKRKYWLFYTLSFLFGARKQIFLTFGPWVLIRIFDQPAYIFARLWIVAALIGVFFQPLLGRIIDRSGERVVLMVDSVCVFAVCAGYVLAGPGGNHKAALYVLYACYVVDQLLFGVNMARTTYLAKIAARKEDVAPSLSMGVTINHAVSMSAPFLGGLIWDAWGYKWVFIVSAGIAILMLIFSGLIRIPRTTSP